MRQCRTLTPDGAEQDEEDEEEPHGQAQAHQAPIVILHAVPHVADEVELGACTPRPHPHIEPVIPETIAVIALIPEQRLRGRRAVKGPSQSSVYKHTALYSVL